MVEVHKKVWGEEHWIVNREYCGKKLILNQQYECSVHYHKIKDETFFVQFGRVLLSLGQEDMILKIGDIVHIPPGTRHQFVGLENSEIFEFSTHHDEDDSFRVTESRRIPDIEFNAILRMVDR